MAALAGLALGHGGTIGLVGEIGSALAITGLMLWALWKSRRAGTENEENGS